MEIHISYYQVWERIDLVIFFYFFFCIYMNFLYVLLIIYYMETRIKDLYLTSGVAVDIYLI